MRPDTLVAGLGNVLMMDEGVGVHVVRRLAETLAADAGVECLDAGTHWPGLLHAMAGRRKAVFVDCAYMGAEPGTIRRFTPAEVRSRKVLTGTAVHEGDLLQVIRLSGELGECPAEVIVFGIEPEQVAPGLELSPRLAGRLAEYVQAVSAEAGRRER